MGKRLRKAPDGTVSIKSFFTSLDKPNDGNVSKSSNDSTLTDEESDDCDVLEGSSDSDWESKSRSRRKRPRKAKSAITKTESKKSGNKNSQKETRKSARNKTRPSSLKEDDIKIIKTVKVVEKSKPVEKEIDADVVAFLKSGIPAATSKAQKIINVRLEEEEFSKTVQYFPVYSHVSEFHSGNCPDHSSWETNLGLKFSSDSFCTLFQPQIIPSILADKIGEFVATKYDEKVANSLKSATALCCKIPSKAAVVEENEESSKSCCDVTKTDLSLPWIEKYEITNKSDLAVDGEALDKMETWLRHWKHDIKDDGGKSRKFLEKKKRKNDSDSFVTSEEESEFKSKSLLLYGPTGCGKTGAISALAKKMDFKVVEVNFSTSRSGKEVLKRVEEATLSHRLESSHACLLLFKDVCLIEPKEDEGFVTAVAQLITSSCRPIVMTMSLPPFPFYVAGDCDTLLLDTKIEKKDPMTVWFASQPASTIVKKVLLPIIKSEFPDYELPRHVVSTLYSVARHCKGDIRRSINQAQLLLQTFNSKPIMDFHSHLSPFVDLGFLRKPNERVSNSSKICKSYARILLSQEESESMKTTHGEIEIDIETEAKCNKTKKTKKNILQEINVLDTIVKNLRFAVDLDLGNSAIQRRSYNECDYDDDIKTGRCQTIRSYFDNNLKDLYSMSKSTSVKSLPSRGGSADSQDSGHVTGEGDSDESESSNPVSVCEEHRGLLPEGFNMHSLLFDSDRDAALEEKLQQLRLDMEPYCGSDGDLVSAGQFNFLNYAYVRTIIKTNKLNSHGPQQKRNKRISYYFNRVGNDLVTSICDTFDFHLDLQISKQCR